MGDNIKIRQAIVVGEKDRVIFEFESDPTEEQMKRFMDKVNEFFKDPEKKALFVGGIKITKLSEK